MATDKDMGARSQKKYSQNNYQNQKSTPVLNKNIGVLFYSTNDIAGTQKFDNVGNLLTFIWQGSTIGVVLPN